MNDDDEFALLRKQAKRLALLFAVMAFIGAVWLVFGMRGGR